MPFPAPWNHLPGKNEMADYLEAYATRFQLPVRLSTKVDALGRNGKRYLVRAGDQQLEAKRVVVATGPFQKPRRTVAAIHRQVCQLALKQGCPAPGYSTVYDIAKGLDLALVVLAHEGSKAYSQAYELLYRREAEHANELWQADHSPLPILLVDAKGEPARPWLTVIPWATTAALSAATSPPSTTP